MKVEEVRAKVPTLLLDTGNALFPGPIEDSELARKKAALIVKTMGELKTAAMVAGGRDLAAGPDWLKEAADKAKLTVLSANLTRKKKRIFEASKVVTVGGVKVGLVGVSPATPFHRYPDVVGEPPVPAAIAEAKKLRGKVDLVVVLAAVPYADALQIARDGQKEIDLVLQSGDSRPAGFPQSFGNTFVITSGERGRMLVRVDLDLSGKGPLVDVGGMERQRQTLVILDEQIAQAKRRMASVSDPVMLRQYEETVKSFEARKVEVAKSITPMEQKGGRTFAASNLDLGAQVPSDPALKAEVEKLQPPGTGGH